LVKKTSSNRKIEQIDFLIAQSNRQRMRIAQELVQTEVTYAKCLGEIINVFQKPMLSRKLISAEESTKIFSNVQTIYQLHEVLSSELSERLNKWDNTQTMGDIFCKMTPFMMISTEYINNFESSHVLLKQLLGKRHKLSDFINGCHSEKYGAGLPYLSSLLITPIQRIPRYELLLKDFLKYTYAEHKDYENVKNAFDAIKEVASTLNEKKREDEEKHEAHHFVKRTFHTPTPCDFCNLIVWGITKQGFTCDKCGFSAHSKCYSHVNYLKSCWGQKINKRHSLSITMLKSSH